jgi:transcriptional regulator with XRE-family HTH domain
MAKKNDLHIKELEGINKKYRSRHVFMTNEARALKKLREEKGLSMKKAGELLGYSDSYISQIENGRENMPIEDKLNRFLEIYDSDVRSFNKLVREFETNLTDLDAIKEILNRLSPSKLKMLRTVAEGFLKGT